MTIIDAEAAHLLRHRLIADVDDVLMTTRSVRKRIDLDREVPRAVLEECLRLAIHAPNAEDRQNWRWLVLTDQRSKDIVAHYYRLAWVRHSREGAGKRRARFRDPRAAERTHESAAWLVENLRHVPALVLPCVLGKPMEPEAIRAAEISWGVDPTARGPRVSAGLPANATYYGSIYPAVWSFQLALRSRGLGSTITTMHLPFADFIGEELGVPRHVTQVAMLPVGYTRGLDFRPARRRPLDEVCFFDTWDTPRVTDDRYRKALAAVVLGEEEADSWPT